MPQKLKDQQHHISENLQNKIKGEIKSTSHMDDVMRTFDKWATNGKAEIMETEHGKNVFKFLKSVKFDNEFRFLDVGCGNGWVVRKVASEKKCKKAIGIDKSKKMIIQAKKIAGPKTGFIHTDIESWKYPGKFEYVFSMESLYYAKSVETALEKIFKMLKPGGKFFCGTDFYTDNRATARWAGIMKIQMHLHSKDEWKQFFRNAGFQVRVRHVKDLTSRKKWKREFGTLFIIGTRPAK